MAECRRRCRPSSTVRCPRSPWCHKRCGHSRWSGSPAGGCRTRRASRSLRCPRKKWSPVVHQVDGCTKTRPPNRQGPRLVLLAPLSGETKKGVTYSGLFWRTPAEHRPAETSSRLLGRTLAERGHKRAVTPAACRGGEGHHGPHIPLPKGSRKRPRPPVIPKRAPYAGSPRAHVPATRRLSGLCAPRAPKLGSTAVRLAPVARWSY